MKYTILTLALLVTGCASTSELEKLDSRVTLVEKAQEKLNQEIQKCHTKMAQIEEKAQQCDLHCKKLESKLDRVFKKSQQK